MKPLLDSLLKPLTKILYASTMCLLMFGTFSEISQQANFPYPVRLVLVIFFFLSTVVFSSTLFMFFLHMIDVTRKDKPV